MNGPFHKSVGMKLLSLLHGVFNVHYRHGIFDVRGRPDAPRLSTMFVWLLALVHILRLGETWSRLPGRRKAGTRTWGIVGGNRSSAKALGEHLLWKNFTKSKMRGMCHLGPGWFWEVGWTSGKLLRKMCVGENKISIRLWLFIESHYFEPGCSGNCSSFLLTVSQT